VRKIGLELATAREHGEKAALLGSLTALSKGLAALEAGYLAQPKTPTESGLAAIGHFEAAFSDLQVAERAAKTAKFMGS
jgi:hypothetical protein